MARINYMTKRLGPSINARMVRMGTCYGIGVQINIILRDLVLTYFEGSEYKTKVLK